MLKRIEKPLVIIAICLFAWLAIYSNGKARVCNEVCRFHKEKVREYEEQQERVVSKIVYLYGAAYE